MTTYPDATREQQAIDRHVANLLAYGSRIERAAYLDELAKARDGGVHRAGQGAVSATMGEAVSQQAVDWFRLLWDLRQREWTVADVARETGQNRVTLLGYLHGAQPPHWRGELLIRLWCQVCQESRDNVPMCSLVIMPRVHGAKAPQEKAMDELERAWR